MATIYERLVEAGAPAIVEPLFYRIREVGEGTSLRLEVRRRRPYTGSRLLASRSVVREVEGEILAALTTAASEAVAEVNASRAAYELVGDHSAAQK